MGEYTHFEPGQSTHFDILSNQCLRVTVERLDPILKPLGFTFESGENAVSTGPFENGFYVRPPIRLALIARGKELGSPNWQYDEKKCGHVALVEKLGCQGQSLLRMHYVSLVTTDGSDIRDAFVSDLEKIVLPVLVGDPARFVEAVTAGYKDFRASIGWPYTEP